MQPTSTCNTCEGGGRGLAAGIFNSEQRSRGQGGRGRYHALTNALHFILINNFIIFYYFIFNLYMFINIYFVYFYFILRLCLL